MYRRKFLVNSGIVGAGLLGASSGVSGTPGFFVNGTFLNGAQPVDVFEKIIDQALPSPAKPAK